MFFFIQIFSLIDHFDCMIKMFCLKDQKNPLAPVSAARHYCCRLFFDVVILVPLSFFFYS